MHVFCKRRHVYGNALKVVESLKGSKEKKEKVDERCLPLGLCSTAP